MSYYERSSQTHIDGTPIFQNEADRRSEAEVASLVAERFRCELSRFGALAPIDWYAARHGRLVGLLELKTRPHPSDKYPTVFLNVRKWLALLLGQQGLGCPAIFVARFTDRICWIRVDAIEPKGARIGGCRTRVKSDSDIEPVIEVEVGAMQTL